ncbi:hypothetical protein QTP70_001668 [Hemibagrus guttatus]|uniref:Reverse transcriptase n=1 Tax=Hemibagrus guttatus TaxID=175788 RepID=A0AAE0R7X3_9TELE|nr:hypothetical protein QTP70_001668 [Hemibagrus guttatus]
MSRLRNANFIETLSTFLGCVIFQMMVEMDTSKLRTVMDWPEPTTVKKLQQFLGFANFYRQFIRNYSSVASPLTSPTSQLCIDPAQRTERPSHCTIIGTL